MSDTEERARAQEFLFKNSTLGPQSPYNSTVDLLVAHARSARREAIEECCKADCDSCNLGIPAILIKGQWVHKQEPWPSACRASAIRAKFAAELEKP